MNGGGGLVPYKPRLRGIVRTSSPVVEYKGGDPTAKVRYSGEQLGSMWAGHVTRNV